MRQLLFAIIIFITVSTFQAQQGNSYTSTSSVELAKQVPLVTISQLYFEIINKIEKAAPEKKEALIDSLYDNSLPSISGLYERFSLYQWWIAFEYADLNKFDKCFNALKQAQKEGIYFPFDRGNRAWPGFISELEKLEGFEDWFKKNLELRNIDQENSKAEYIINLPEDYSDSNMYPIVLLFTGGFGSHMQLFENWKSDLLDKDYIVVYCQGSVRRGSYLTSFPGRNFDEIKDIYMQVISKYSVDTTQIILAGQSAGGYRAVRLAMEEILPAKGLLLAFPVKPDEVTDLQIRKAAERGVKAAILAGENDRTFLKGQIELAYIFNKGDLPTRFLIFPNLGHTFPPEFEKHIAESLDFINGKE